MRCAVLVLVAVCFAPGVMSWSVSAGENATAPTNPYNGLQEREEVYEFTAKPAVKKEGAVWVITFASKAACDATVSIIDKDGKVVRHLASGVLGKNAPWPFQQNSLSQKVEWDGQDDMGKAAPAGCRVRVGLGLQAAFERNIGYDPYAISPTRKGSPLRVLHTATDAEGKTFALQEFRSTVFGRVYDKGGNYVRTFYPPPAGEVEKWKDLIHTPAKKEAPFATTLWGDKSLYTDRYGAWAKQSSGEKMAPGVLAAFSGVPEAATKRDVAPEFLARAKLPSVDEGRMGKYYILEASLGTKYFRMCVDRYTEKLYITGDRQGLFRFDGKTGEFDPSWFPKGEMDKVAECHVGPDGLLYLRIGFLGYGQWIARLDQSGKPVPFKDCTTPKWTGDATGPSVLTKSDKFGEGPRPEALKTEAIPVLWTGLVGHSTIHDRGLYVAPNGLIVAAVSFISKEFAEKYGDFSGLTAQPSNNGNQYRGTFVQVWTADGKILTANAVGNTINGHGAAMDRNGNIYTAFTALPAGQDMPDGVTDRKALNAWGGIGSIVKFPGQGGKYPVGRTATPGKSDDSIPPAPEGAISLHKGWIAGAAWMYGGLPSQATDCTCHNVRWDMDYWARTFVPANQINSVVVLDANGNRLARLGRYGNVDDTDADVKAGRDGLRFSWIRALCVSDKALYVGDPDNFRILKAALKYAAEETAPLP